MFFFSPLKPTKAKKENQDKLKKENTSKTENTKPKSASKNKTKQNMESVLCWPPTPGLRISPGVRWIYPITLHLREQIFPFPTGINCK